MDARGGDVHLKSQTSVMLLCLYIFAWQAENKQEILLSRFNTEGETQEMHNRKFVISLLNIYIVVLGTHILTHSS